jgi:hypothetical protein
MNASGEMGNILFLYSFIVNDMPDDQSKYLLRSVLLKTCILVKSAYSTMPYETDTLANYREAYCKLIGDIMTSYSSLAEYLREIRK